MSCTSCDPDLWDELLCCVDGYLYDVCGDPHCGGCCESAGQCDCLCHVQVQVSDTVAWKPTPWHFTDDVGNVYGILTEPWTPLAIERPTTWCPGRVCTDPRCPDWLVEMCRAYTKAPCSAEPSDPAVGS